MAIPTGQTGQTKRPPYFHIAMEEDGLWWWVLKGHSHDAITHSPTGFATREAALTNLKDLIAATRVIPDIIESR